MAAFYFLGSWDDSWSIVSAILEDPELSLVPDLRSDVPEFPFAKRLDDVLKATLLEKKRIHLVHEVLTVPTSH